MVLDGRTAALWSGGLSWPGFVAVAEGPEGGRFIVPRPEEVAAILATGAALRPQPVPADSYRGQDLALASVGSWSVILARPGLGEEIGYRFARALHRAEWRLGEALVQARETTPANTARAAASPGALHPGAPRYLREAGFLR